jgi:hypothetical protein
VSGHSVLKTCHFHAVNYQSVSGKRVSMIIPHPGALNSIFFL